MPGCASRMLALPLEFRVDAELNVGRGVSLLTHTGTEEIEIAQHRAAGGRSNLQMLDPGITHLHSNPVFVVLHHGIVEPQFVQRRKHIVGAVAFVSQIGGDAKLPIVIEVVDQRRLRENTFKPQVVAEKPDQSAAGGDDRVLIERATQANHTENFVFLERERDKNFPRNVKGITGDAVLKVNARIELDTGAGMVLYHIFNCEMSVDRLEVVGQPIIGPAKIVTLVLEPGAEIPFSGDEKPMVITEIIIK